MNTVVIVQARSGSTRLPGKILKQVLGKTLLELQMERIQSATTPTYVVVATTYLPEDDVIERICINNGYDYIRGHPINLLDRHYQAATKFRAGIAVKIPSDCPLIDPAIIDKVIIYQKRNLDKYDFVSNLHPPTYPDGNDVEAMPVKTLETAWREAKGIYELEHTTPYIWDNPGRFRIGNVTWEKGLNYSMTHRFTLDYPEDLEFIRNIYERLYPANPLFSLDDILGLLGEKPELMNINSKYAGVNWYRNHLDSLKTIGRSQTKII